VFSPTPAVSPQVSGTIGVDVFNVGAEASHGPITVTDTLPPGVRAVEAGALKARGNGVIGVEPFFIPGLWVCMGNGQGAPPGVAGASVVTCTNKETKLSEGEEDLPGFPGGGGMPTLRPLFRHPRPVVGIAVDVQPGAEEHEVNHVTISGGGAPTSASAQAPVTISSTPPGFEFTAWDGWFSNADGTLDTQAGSHPYQATFTYDLATLLNQEGGVDSAGGEARNIEVQLPPGFVGNPTATPQCTRLQFEAEQCPHASQIGYVMVYFAQTPPLGFQLFNLVPPPGVPAEFAFTLQSVDTFLDAGVRSGSDYGITEHVNNIAQKEPPHVVTVIWGDPGDPSHDLWRNGTPNGCQQEESEHPGNVCSPQDRPISRPFLTLPTACGVPQPFVIKATSWSGRTTKATFYNHDSNGNPTGFTGCGHLEFAPTITTAPDTARADTPTGLTVEVKPPLGGLEELEGVGSADIQNTTVTLPEGFVINPGQAAGLQACQFSEAHVGDGNDGPASCPSASKVGTVTIKSPLVEGAAEKQFEGNVYVLQSNPPELKLLVAASADGVNLKLVGVVHLDEQTGQLTTKFDGTPELPFTVFKLSFSGGPQAALDTPTQCGTYMTNADFNPWSSPFVGDMLTNAGFDVTEGPGGGACPSNPMPFSPSLVAGATTDRAGAFTGFSMLLQRGDGQQRIERLQFKAPAGLAGMISNVPLCPEPQAQTGGCSAVSQIGHASVASGPGPYPLVLPQPGAPELPIYLTGPYEGAPFGLSIVTPVIAGPFNLGTIVTRAKIEVDPRTAQITVTTDPLPQVVKGVPTDLRSVDAVIDREGFMFNPTNCEPSAFSGTAWGTPPPGAGGLGVSSAISSRFQMGSCRELAFKPKFSATASGKNSKANGVSLDVRVAYPAQPQGSEANIAKVKVDLPKQLPSRLTTLQKACTAAQFATNPAGCPAASVVGHAVVHTPVLPIPLEGPAYFVSNGGEAFPNLIMVLQGYGVTVDLVGDTFIDKQGITSSTFKATPDVPFSTFELNLPQGPSSALTTNVPAGAQYSLCGQRLTMPTQLIAQNGATINQATPISVSGCARKKSLTRAQKLAAALRACHKKHGHKRTVCERQARKRYGPAGSKRSVKKK
jgi:hypothetical protein